MMSFAKVLVGFSIFFLLALVFSPFMVSSLNALEIGVSSEVRLQFSRPEEIVLHSDNYVYVRGVVVGVNEGELLNITYGLYNEYPPSLFAVLVLVTVNLYDDNGNIIASANDYKVFYDRGFQVGTVYFTGVNIIDVKTVEVSLTVIRL